METLDRARVVESVVGNFDHRHASLVVATVATVGSLYFSLGMGIAPCDLCWYQRILMYPLVPFLAVGVLKGDDLAAYVLPLSVGGFGIAAYHNYLQMTPSSGSICTGGVPCGLPSAYFFKDIVPGGITIPQMSLTAFGIITALFFLSRFTRVGR
jgi:disulfide bond formation protein DsbB